MQRRTLEDMDNESVPFDMGEFIMKYELVETRQSEDAYLAQCEEENKNGNSK